MIPDMSNSPLFEACLELHEPDLVFTPSLDSNTAGNFCSIIQGIIEEIIQLSKLMPRIYDKNNVNDYFVSHVTRFRFQLKNNALIITPIGGNEFQLRHL